MIALTRLNGERIMVNADLIETVESAPDTILTLISGNKLVIRENMDLVQERIVDFKRKIYGPPSS